MAWVRKVPGAGNLPRWRMVGPKTMFTLSGRPMSRFSRISCSTKIRPLTGRSRAMVVENSDRVDRQLPAVAGVLVLAGERLRQPGQPCAGEPVDLLAGQPVADPLDRLGVADRAERGVQRGERDPGLQALPLGAYSCPVK